MRRILGLPIKYKNKMAFAYLTSSLMMASYRVCVLQNIPSNCNNSPDFSS